MPKIQQFFPPFRVRHEMPFYSFLMVLEIWISNREGKGMETFRTKISILYISFTGLAMEQLRELRCASFHNEPFLQMLIDVKSQVRFPQVCQLNKKTSLSVDSTITMWRAIGKCRDRESERQTFLLDSWNVDECLMNQLSLRPNQAESFPLRFC